MKYLSISNKTHADWIQPILIMIIFETVTTGYSRYQPSTILLILVQSCSDLSLITWTSTAGLWIVTEHIRRSIDHCERDENIS